MSSGTLPVGRATPVIPERTMGEAASHTQEIPTAKSVKALVSAYYMIVVSTGLLIAIGFIMVVSSQLKMTSDDRPVPIDTWMSALQQGVYILVGLIAAFLVSRVPARAWQALAWIALLATATLQAAVIAGLGVSSGGNTNWLRVGSMTVQPSEFLKFGLALWLGTVLANKASKLGDWLNLLVPTLLGMGLAGGLVLLGRDVGTAAVIGAFAIGALVIAGVPWRRIAVIGAGLAAVGITAMLTNDQRLARLNAVVDPANCPKDGSCWQIRHATFALAEGHIVGEGLGNSKEAWNWLSQSESDFIFAIIGEEFGLVGTLTVVLLFGVLTIGLFQVVRHHPSRFAQIAVGAIACWLCAQAIINMGMVVQFLPVIGVPLPFVSSGGSALLASMAAIGAVLGLMRQDPQIGPALRARPRVLGGAGAVTSAGRARRADRQSSACRDARTGRAGRAGRAGRIGRAGRKARRAADTGTGRVPR